MIITHRLDILAVTESWQTGDHRDNYAIADILATLPGYAVYCAPRKARKGGGICIIHRKEFEVKVNEASDTDTFEYVDVFFTSSNQSSFRSVIIYRPPRSKANPVKMTEFFTEFSSLTESLSVYPGRCLIAGDLNIHLDKPDDHDTKRMQETLSSAGLKQHITDSTHKRGHTLDVIISRVCEDLVVTPTVIRGLKSDHHAVKCDLNVSRPKLCKQTVTFRKLRDIDLQDFSNDILSSGLNDCTGDVTCLIEKYDSVLRELMEKHAPEIEHHISLRPHAPWYNDSFRNEKRKKRQLERKMLKSGLQIDREIFHEHCDNYHKTLHRAKIEYYTSEFAGCNQRQLFRLTDKLSSAKATKSLPSHDSLESLTSDFHHFFDTKIKEICDDLADCDVPPMTVEIGDSCDSTFSKFDEVDSECVRKIIMDSAKTSCALDPIPTWILAKKEVIDALLPTITRIINMSLAEGVIPSTLKRALVTPLIKKSNADPDVFKNYRPISNLPFIFKTIERVASKQIQDYVNNNDLNASHQSAYRKYHSTETALLRVTNDILRAVDNHRRVIVVLLDLSAAFDTIDHQVLLRRLQDRFGIKGTALRWMSSYFHGREQCIIINGVQSNWKRVYCGAPQGSVFGPMAFSYYSAPIEDIIKAHGLECMIYADDSQIYFSFNDEDQDAATSRIEACVADIRSWMVTNKLKLNDGKTEILHLSSRFTSPSEAPSLRVGEDDIAPAPSVRDLGVVIDEHVTMKQHVNSVCQRTSYALYSIGKLRAYLDQASAEKLIHAFVSSRIDSCNSLLFGLPGAELDRLQRVQNAAARIITGVKGHVHMKPILRQLHWLPIRQRIIFKILLLAYKAVNGLAPSYVSDMLTIHHPVRNLRSTSTECVLLKPPSTRSIRTSTYGDRAFSSAAPKLWNELPENIRSAKTVDRFKSLLKTHLFNND